MKYLHGILTVIILSSVYQVLEGKEVEQKKGVLSWDKYYRAADISAFAKALAKNNDHVTLKKLGKTYENRRLEALVFSERVTPVTADPARADARVRTPSESSGRQMSARVKRNQRVRDRRQQDAVIRELVDTKQMIKENNIRNKKKKPVIVIEAGAHAREWISPAVATYIAKQLAESGNSDLLKHATWVVVPLLNPDGYEYSHTTNRYWRKNRRLNKGSPSCRGVDLNRNFKHAWATTGSSTDECSDIYHGKKAFSEKESRAMKKLLKKFKNVKLYLTLHSYGQVILHPWGYTSDEPADVSKLKTMGDAFSKHISDNGGRVYGVEQAGVSYQSGGGSDDYAYSLGIPYSYTFELPDKGTDGFATPPEKILGISQEVWKGLRCLLGDLVPEAKSLC